MRSFVYTNVDRDGMLEGPDLDEVAARGRGGARRASSSRAGSATLDAPARRSPRLADLEGVIVGKALYERRFTVAEAHAALA